MMKKNKIIKLIGSDKCKKCDLLFGLIDHHIKQKYLTIRIEKIQSISDEAINLAIDFDINTIPFAVFNNKILVFSEQIAINDLEKFLT